jgi:hypothetical protein
MIAPETRRYNVTPKEWSELSYEANRGELRMEVYNSFLSNLGSSGGVVINLFGGLKPIAAALVSPYNILVFIGKSLILLAGLFIYSYIVHVCR